MALIDDTRAAWGAAPNTASGGTRINPGSRVGISWHYDGGATLGLAGRPHSACLTRTKAVQRFHQGPGRDWQDIGYNLFVCQHGRVIEARGVDLQGAHSPGVNATHYGVQFMVGGSESPTPAAYARAAQLARDLAAHSGRSLRQWGHRDDPKAATACPGDLIERWVKTGGPNADIRPTTPPVTGGTYVVRSGDTLSRIATAHKVAVADLVRWNGIKDADHIEVGQRLTVKAPAATKPAPKPAPKPSGKPRIKVANVRPGKKNEDIGRFNDLLWKWHGPDFKRQWQARWMAESRTELGPNTQRVLQAAYATLARRYPSRFEPVTLPCWPGPELIKEIGGIPE